MTTHTDKAYERELAELREQLLAMGGKVEAAIASERARGHRARRRRWPSRCKTQDREINRLEVEIDGACRRILALRQPAACDLRFITTALKIVTDLERMGDLAVNVAERALELCPGAAAAPRSTTWPSWPTSPRPSSSGALDAFVAGDVDKAEEVMHGDELLDALYLKIFNEPARA